MANIYYKKVTKKATHPENKPRKTIRMTKKTVEQNKPKKVVKLNRK